MYADLYSNTSQIIFYNNLAVKFHSLLSDLPGLGVFS
jgi:hypothetical protein